MGSFPTQASLITGVNCDLCETQPLVTFWEACFREQRTDRSSQGDAEPSIDQKMGLRVGSEVCVCVWRGGWREAVKAMAIRFVSAHKPEFAKAFGGSV